VRLINDETKENLGVVSLSKALELAEAAQLDLVEVAPDANPPVCRIMDFGKFQYEKQRRERKARKQQKVVEVKEIRLTPSTDDHHLGFKVRDARRWIQEGMKVRISIKFKGRQNLHPQLGRERLQNIAEELKDVAAIEQAPSMEGTTMLMILAPQSGEKKS
jgi:translation initiation factor IF-3